MLASIWFFLWGLLWAVYFVLDGFDLGLGSLLPFVSKTETDKRMVYNAMGPFWDGNEVWLIAAGGVTFAAFPKVYAVMFSGLYTALMLLLVALIVRGVSFEFRNKVHSGFWRSIWDGCLFMGSFLPALLFGVAFANIFKGLPIDGQGVFHGNIFTLLNPYGLLGGIFFVCLFAMHGALWLAVRTKGDLQVRSGLLAVRLWKPMVILLVLFLIFSAWSTKLFSNYLAHPVLLIVLAVPIAGLFWSRDQMGKQAWGKAWLASALTIFGISFFGFIGLYPALLPSSLNPAFSLTIYNGASSTLTLQIMLTVVLIFIPIIILYQGWVYKTFSFTLQESDLEYDEAY